MPAHSHTASGSDSENDTNDPTNNYWGVDELGDSYRDDSNVTMSGVALGNAGSSQPHNNLPPYLALNFIIALVGLYPSRS